MYQITQKLSTYKNTYFYFPASESQDPGVAQLGGSGSKPLPHAVRY